MRCKNIVLLSVIVIALCGTISWTVSAADETFYGSTQDGYLRTSHGTYDTARDAANADTATSGGNYVYVGQTTGWDIRRSFFYFDTSALPDAASIYKAHLYVYVDVLPATLGVMPVQAITHPSLPLVVADYDRTYYMTAGWSQAITGTGWQNIVIRDGREPGGNIGCDVSVTGMTKVGLFATADYAHSPPTPTATGHLKLRSAETADKPYLVVEYNQKPTVPIIVTSPETEYQHSYVSLGVMSTDPDGDDIQYKVDWGDGHTSDWSSARPSGELTSVQYKYGAVGAYTIKVKARDTAQTSDRTYFDNRENAVWSGSVQVETVKYLSGSEPDSEQFVPNEDQALLAIHAAFKESEPVVEGVAVALNDGEAGKSNSLHVWWDLNDAAQADPHLKVALSIRTITGETYIDTVYAWKYDDERGPYIINQWNERFGQGAGRWDFVICASFLNPNEPAGSDAGNNKNELRFILGFPLTFNVMLVAYAVIAITVIVIIWKRKQIFYKFYIDPDDLPTTEELINRNVGKKMRDKIEALRHKKYAYGKSGSKTVAWLSDAIKPTKDSWRKHRGKAAQQNRRGLERTKALLSPIPGKKSPFRTAPLWMTHEQAEQYRMNMERKLKEREAAIGEGLLESIMRPYRKAERYAAQLEQEQQRAKEQEERQRAEAEEKANRKRDAIAKRFKMSMNRPIQRREREMKSLKPVTLYKDKQALEQYLSAVDQGLKTKKLSKPKREELLDLRNEINQQLKQTEHILKRTRVSGAGAQEQKKKSYSKPNKDGKKKQTNAKEKEMMEKEYPLLDAYQIFEKRLRKNTIPHTTEKKWLKQMSGGVFKMSEFTEKVTEGNAIIKDITLRVNNAKNPDEKEKFQGLLDKAKKKQEHIINIDKKLTALQVGGGLQRKIFNDIPHSPYVDRGGSIVLRNEYDELTKLRKKSNEQNIRVKTEGKKLAEDSSTRKKLIMEINDTLERINALKKRDIRYHFGGTLGTLEKIAVENKQKLKKLNEKVEKSKQKKQSKPKKGSKGKNNQTSYKRRRRPALKKQKQNAKKKKKVLISWR